MHKSSHTSISLKRGTGCTGYGSGGTGGGLAEGIGIGYRGGAVGYALDLTSPEVEFICSPSLRDTSFVPSR